MLAAANALHRLLERIAGASGWLLMVLMAVTCVDVVFRKIGVVGFPYVKFQEMEWHLHTAIFSLWMGYNYVINAHPRVDSYVEGISFRRRAWLELAGCVLFAIPYTWVLVYYGWDFVRTAFVMNETSDAPLGLGYRWVIKAVLYAGLWLLLLGAISVLLRLIAFLFCKRPQEEVQLRIGHSASEV